LPTFKLIEPGAQVDKFFSLTFNATKGKTPYTFTTNSTLPAGLTLSPSGTLSGTPLLAAAPQAAKDYNIVVRVTGSNAIPQSSTRTYTLTVVPAAAPVITTKTLPDAEMGEEYYFDDLVITGGKPPYKFKAAAAFPANLVIAEDGTISGIPRLAGNYRLRISATDTNNRTGTAYVSLIVSDAPTPKITTTSPLYWTLNQTVTTTLAATGGRAPYKWARASTSTDPLRNFPTGVTLSQNGTFSGMPTAAGNFTVPIRVTDDLGKGSTKTFIIIVNGALSITSQSPLETGFVGVSSNLTLAAQGGIAPYKWSLKNRGTLPITMNLTTTGRLSGTANATGNFSFTAEVADSRNGTVGRAEKQLTLPVINYNLAISTTSLPAGTAGSSYTATPLVATGGKPPYNWSFTSTPALSGLSASTGNLTGRPAAAGNYTLALKVTDANSRSANRTIALRVNESAALAFDPLTLPNGRVATSYNGTLGAKGGFSPYTFTLKTGSTLPAGLRLATSGEITGTPTTAGTYKFTVVLKDSKTPTATTIEREFTLVIDAYGMSVGGPATITGKRYSSITPAQFTVTGGTANYTWSATPALPAALNLDSKTGLVSGDLTAAVGNYTVAIKVTDGNRQSATRNVTVSITQPTLVAWVTTATLPEGQVGVSYTELTLAATGGRPDYTYALKTGSTLPSGLNLSAGKISGMPRTAGTFKFTLVASDSQSPTKATAEREFTVVIKPAVPLAITAPNPMPAANVGSVYGPASFTASGGLPPYTWSVTPSPAAPGLTFSGGNLTGIPTTVGNYTFTVRLADSASKNATQTVTLQVLPAGLLEWVTPDLLSGGMVLSTYNATLTTRGGFAPVTITRISGNLSAGLTQSGTRISGTPTVAGNATFTLQARDKNGITANRTFTLPIAPYDLAVSADSPSLVSGTANQPFSSDPFNADGGDGEYTWSISGTKPAWLSINRDSGVLSGTSNATGNWTVSVSVKDGKQQTANKTCTVSIGLGEPPVLNATQQLPAGMVGVPYPNPAIDADGGIEPYRFTVKTSSALPAGLSINSTTGVISGTPTAAGNTTTTIVATGADGASAERAYTIRIDAYDLVVNIPATIPGQANKPLVPAILDVTGGLEPYTWTVAPALPAGLTLNATTGSITGTPTTAGNTTVTFTVRDGRQRTATAATTFVISAADLLEFTTAANLPNGKVASFYVADPTIQPAPTLSTGITLEGKGGFAPYTYSLMSGSALPPGLTLANGEITGTPTLAGTFKFTLVIKDARNTTAEREFTIIVAPYGMEIVSDYSGNVIAAKANQAVTADFRVIGGRPNYTWSITGTKPAWLSVNSASGQLTGTPTAAGNTTITLSVRDGASQNATANLTIAVEAADPLYISTAPNLGTVNINTAFSQTLQALGGKPNYTWSFVSKGNLPTNASISTAGVLTANSSTALTANFTVRVQDTASPAANATQTMTLTFRNPATLAVVTDSLPEGRVNQDYSHQLAATGGTNPFEWALTNNSTLPAGLDLALTGWITGKPTAAGNTTLTFEVTDANGAKATRQFVLVIKAATSGNVTASGKLFTDVTDSVNIPQHSVIAVEDFNNDGREDVLARNDDGTLNLLVAQGAFDLRDSTAQAGLTGVTPALVADFNNDGVTDILGTNTQRTEATLYLNNGQGTFTKQVLTGLLTGDLAGYRQVSYADIDADGDLDLVFNINATSGGGIAAVLNQSNISQTAAPLFSGKTYLIKTTWKNPSFSITDANGDGKPDILALETNSASISESYTPRPVRLYMNSGNSTADYANPTGAKILAGFTEKTDSGITLGCESGPFFSWDMDNDGDLDLINGAKDWPRAGAIPRVYINDGTGKYAQKDSPIIQDRFYHWGATTFDADLDGDLDAVWSGTHNFSNMYPRMWENGATYLKATTGNGTFDTTKAFFDSTTNWGMTANFPGNGSPFSSNNYSNGYAADLDGDGDLDYVYYCWNNFGPQRLFKVFRNDSDLKPANWLKVELVGSISPAQGTGARVEVELKDALANKPIQVTDSIRYQAVLGNFTWNQAKADAETKGGHLATITSADEWQKIQQSLGSSLNGKNLWIGATDAEQEGDWKWITGEAWSYSRWYPGEPNNFPFVTEGQDFIHIWGSGDSELRWADSHPQALFNYLLEREDPIATTSTLAQYLGADTGSATKSSLTFGLADKAQASKVTVYWPSGLKSVLENVAANQIIQIHEIDELPPERPTEEGDVIAWGANPNGETTIPTALNRVVQIAAGDSSSAALRADGTVSVWGTNWAGQRNVPADLKDIVQVAAGNNHYLALDSQGKVTGWGWNTSNQTTIPTTLRRAKFVAAGFNTSYALTGDGRILAWGANDQGQSTIPAGLSDVTALAAGRGHALALKGDGTVVAWGRNDMGQATVPAGLTDVIQIAAGDYHSVALKANGTVVAWGANWTAQATVPAGLTNVVQISAEGDRTLAFKADNSIVNWGFNPDNVTPPPAPGNVLGIAAGAKHGLALVRKIQIAVDGDIPTGTEGNSLDFGLTANGGSGSYTWSIPGTKPDWITIDSATGKISGTPAAAGTYSFIVRASSGGRWGEIEVILEVIKPELAILWVATSGSDTAGDGTLVKPFATVQKAVDTSRAGGTIMVQPGSYNGTVSIVGKSVKLLSQSGEAQTTLRGVKGKTVIEIAGEGTVIDGFTITGGTGRPQPSSYGFDYYGGGIHCRTTATVKNCIIRGNGAGTPGRDSATFGGAIYSNGKPTDILTVENCVLAENYAWASGGATLTEVSKIILDRVTVYKNDSRNFFGYQGGVSLANGGKMDLMNSILWSNGGDQIGAFAYPYNRGTVATVTYTLSQSGVKSGGIETFTAGTGNLGTDPKLNGDYSLQEGSPAIDTANPVLKDPDNTRADMGYQAGRRSGNFDSDGDGVNDYREMYDGTNPFDAKSFNPPSVGLVAHYPFDGNAKDESGNGRNGTMFSVTSSTNRFRDASTALDFNGINSYVNVQQSSFLNFGAGDFSIFLWIRSTGGYFPTILNNANDIWPTSTGLEFSLYYPTSNNLALVHGNSRSDIWTEGAVSQNEWIHVGVSCQQGTERLWINGMQVASRQQPRAIGDSNWPLLIGAAALGDTSELFKGQLDELRIYNRALTAAEVSQLYSEESGEPNMVLVQGGTLPEGSALANQTVSAFHIARFETTWAEYREVVKWAVQNGYEFRFSREFVTSDSNHGQVFTGSNYPAYVWSWNDAAKWCNAKSEMEGFQPVYTVNGAVFKKGQQIPEWNPNANGYRLPTEAEWEWAARGGAQSKGYTYAGSNNIEEVAWYWGNSPNIMKPVGGKAPNELGLYDMSGNQWEWCWDAVTGGRARRGGAGTPDHCTVFFRNGIYLDFPSMGIRPVRNAIGDMVTVQGGTLPQSSQLAGQTVQAFQIGRTEVTWGEWKTVRTWAAANGYSDLATVGTAASDDRPAVQMNWHDALKWSNAKSQMEGLVPVYTINGSTYKTGQAVPAFNPTANGYRLPAESEWEWAARGGASSLGYTYSGGNTLGSVAWFGDNVPTAASRPIGTKSSNELGIFDMSGNVWEWCYDNSGASRVTRGGSWFRGASTGGVAQCAVANRGFNNLDITSRSMPDVGFRLFRNIGPKISISGTLPEATLNQAYAGYTFGVVGSTGDKVWSISEGTLPPGMSFSANGTLSGTPTTAGTYTFVIRLESGGYWDEVEVELEVVAPTDISRGLKAYFKLDGNYTDSTGNLTPIVPNGTTFAADPRGIAGSAIAFNTSQNARLKGLGSILNTNEFTFSGWFYYDSAINHPMEYGFGFKQYGFSDTAPDGSHPEFRINNSGNPYNGLQITLGGDGIIRPGYNPGFNKWFHVAISLRGNPQKEWVLYLDGKKVANGNVEAPNTIQWPSDLGLGGGIEAGNFYWGTPSSGRLDNLRFYNRIISPAEVDKIYKDELGVNEMVTVQGGTLPAGSGLAGQTVATFQIGKYEVTWEEWQAVRTYAIANGYDLTGVGNGTASTHPVQQVSWYDAVKWCNAKSQKEGLVPVYTVNGTTYKAGQVAPTQSASANGYRLPSEKEWEWAARGSVTSQGYTYSGSNDINAVAWYASNSSGADKPVGTKAANELGIYDMSGNAFEWCEDVANASNRRFRGGSWNDSVVDCPVVARNSTYLGYRSSRLGFRLAKNMDYSAMVTVQGGTLPAGQASNQAGQVVQNLQIGKYEVVWKEWQDVRLYALANGYDIPSLGFGSGDSHPIYGASWFDILKWCNAKSQKEGLTPVYSVNGATYKTGQVVPEVNLSGSGYRLPTMAEWEWAAKGGSESKGYIYSGSNNINDVAWSKGSGINC
jgi:formylglycine-generating enzyme required for sulfatase activity